MADGAANPRTEEELRHFFNYYANRKPDVYPNIPPKPQVSESKTPPTASDSQQSGTPSTDPYPNIGSTLQKSLETSAFIPSAETETDSKAVSPKENGGRSGDLSGVAGSGNQTVQDGPSSDGQQEKADLLEKDDTDYEMIEAIPDQPTKSTAGGRPT